MLAGPAPRRSIRTGDWGVGGGAPNPLGANEGGGGGPPPLGNRPDREMGARGGNPTTRSGPEHGGGNDDDRFGPIDVRPLRQVLVRQFLRCQSTGHVVPKILA